MDNLLQKKLAMWFVDPIIHLSTIPSKKALQSPLLSHGMILLKYTGESQDTWEHSTSINIASLDWNRPKPDIMKEGYWIPKIPQAEMSLQSYLVKAVSIKRKKKKTMIQMAKQMLIQRLRTMDPLPRARSIVELPQGHTASEPQAQSVEP
jgi:hypothetical protein